MIYADVWASMGQKDEAAEREKIFAPFQAPRLTGRWPRPLPWPLGLPACLLSRCHSGPSRPTPGRVHPPR